MKNTGVWVFVTFLIIGMAIYSNVLHGEFISDDYVTIVNNPAVRHLELKPLWEAFNTRVLTGLTFASNYHFGQLNPFGYHLINIFIHIFNAWLVFVLTCLTLRTPFLRQKQLPAERIAFYGAMIFLCHPLQTQAVSFITQRAVSFATLVYLSTLILYLKGRLEHPRYFAMSWLVLLVGIFAKEMILTLPAILIAYEIFFFTSFKKEWKERFKKILPYILIISLVPAALWLDRTGSVLNLKDQVSHRTINWHYFLTELNVLREYGRLIVFPVNLNHDHDLSLAKSIFEPATLYSLFGIFIVIGFAVWQWRRHRFLSFCIAWFFITIFLEFWVPVFVNRGVMYEHWLYLPMVGLSMLTAYLLCLLIKREQVQQTIFLCLIIVLGTLTYVRNFVWQNEIIFWEDVVKKSPSKPTVYLGAGAAYQRKADYTQALQSYQKGLEKFYQRKTLYVQELDRVYLARIYNNMGMVYFIRFQDDRAFEYFQKAIEIYPSMPEPYSNLGFVYLEKKDYSKALAFYKKSLQYQGNHEKTCRYLPEVFQALGLKEDEEFKKACPK